MSQRGLLLERSGEFFHIYNRGVNRCTLFYSDEDYEQFVDLMESALAFSDVSIHCYSLMPNHFHLILRQNSSRALSSYMKVITERYAKRMNAINRRAGHLFQGRYKLKHIDDKAYLIHLSRYIHLNPVQAKLVTLPGDWRFSSCADYEKGQNGGFVTTDVILSQAGGISGYRMYLHEKCPGCGEEIERYLIEKQLL